MGFFSYAGMMSFFPSDSIMRLISLFTLVPAFFFFVIFIHEMGHALAAWAMRYRVHIIAVGTHGFDPVNRKFRKIVDYSDNEVAGFIHYSPDWPIKSRWGEIFVSFAGPLATIILGLILLWLDSQGEASYMRRHHAFFYLAMVCFLDATVNLIPFKSDGTHKNDGRSIFESLFKSEWTLKSWLNMRAYAASCYQQNSVSDEEWQVFREQCWKSNDADFQHVLRYLAWAKTDPAAFLAATKLDEIEGVDIIKHVKWQYVASSVLTGRYNEALLQVMPENIEAKNHIYHFAKVLLEYGGGNTKATTLAINDARQAFRKAVGQVPGEEEAIFKAIENGEPLPALKWELSPSP